MSSISYLIDLPKILDERGNLTFIESLNHINFDIKRVYWIYDVPGGEERGGHAFKNSSELIIAISGSFDISLDSGTEKNKFTLNRSYQGVFVPKLTWRSIDNFSTNALCLILSSSVFNEIDYIRDVNEFKSLFNSKTD